MTAPPGYWDRRKHYVIGALVKADAFPDVTVEDYEAHLQAFADRGVPAYLACELALDQARKTLPSACEVHPW